MSNRFTLIIHDDDGEVSLEIQDYFTRTKAEITAEELKDASGLGIGGLSKMLVKLAKREYEHIFLKTEQLNKQP